MYSNFVVPEWVYFIAGVVVYLSYHPLAFDLSTFINRED